MIVNRQSLYIFRQLSDLLLLNTAFILSTIYTQSWETLIHRYYMFFLLVGLNILWILFTNATGFYSDFHSRNISFQFVNILKETAAQVIASILFIFLAKEDLFTRNFIVYYAILLIVLVSLRTIVFRKTLKSLRKKGRNIRNLIIIGTGEVAKKFEKMINSNPDFGYKFAGFIGEPNTSSSEENLLGTTDELEKLISSKKVDEVVIALTRKSDDFLDDVIAICDRNAVRTHIIPDYLRFLSSRFEVTMFGDFPIITARDEPLAEVHWRFIKRSFDLIFSFMVTLLIISWLYPLIFIISKISSRGKVFFVQERIGSKNIKFKCYKLRTMISPDIKSTDNFQPVVENDPRVTKFGRFLRKSNIDELPQFINVLKGDMSVVGPRPHAVQYDKRYGKIFETIRLRHNVRPGITGWAQVHGLRGDVSDEDENKKRARKRIEYDIWYIENWSLNLDIQIIMITIWQMLRGKTKGI